MPKKSKINEKQFINLWEAGKTHSDIATAFGVSERTSQRFARKLKAEGRIEDRVVDVATNLAKQKQRLQDINRIERKAFRNNARLENAVREIYDEFIEVLEKHRLPKSATKRKKIKRNTKATGLIQITDTHFNELINMSFNKYDFPIAAKRLQKFVTEAAEFLKFKGVTDVCVAFTGDLMNSDRRTDEKLAQATNRAKALFLSISILEQAIMQLNEDFNVSVASVIGNESRIQDEIGWLDETASDNYDYIIHNCLEVLFRDSDIKFFVGGKDGCLGSPTEQVVEVSGQNVLLLHGNQVKRSNRESTIQSIVGKWSRHGINIDFVIDGHLHSARIGDNEARAASLSGGNTYSNDGLQLYSRASQNVHVFYGDGNRDSLKIDLQEYNGYDGYNIQRELEAYNCKSLDKAKKKTTVVKLVV